MARGIRDEQPDVTIKDAIVKRASEKAILIKTASGEEIWLPRSQLRGPSAELQPSLTTKVRVTMSSWIAGEKNLVDCGDGDESGDSSSDEDDTGGYDA